MHNCILYQTKSKTKTPNPFLTFRNSNVLSLTKLYRQPKSPNPNEKNNNIMGACGSERLTIGRRVGESLARTELHFCREEIRVFDHESGFD